mmetsp:Transcript_13909/g.22708  ORF Transcript_13909/g.22708 Transcript_13909/m.22708 type:complete len:641 (+) Transcript_13909:209-2131(+)
MFSRQSQHVLKLGVRYLSVKGTPAAAEKVLRKYPKGAETISNKALRKHDFVLGKFNVALIGRPNVGKSTIYNRLVTNKTRRSRAIVSEIAGTTRDRKEGEAHIGDLDFLLTDTGGFEDLRQKQRTATQLLAPSHGTTLVNSMQFQTAQALRKADLVCLIVDAQDGITEDDVVLSRWVRKHMREDHANKEAGLSGVCLIANKSEGRGEGFAWEGHDAAWAMFLQDCYKLGFGDPIPVSASHGQGLGDIHNALLPYAQAAGAKEAKRLAELEASDLAASSIEKDDGVVTISVIGRPNVGKSTMLNSILGEERCITGPVPGLTRDTVAIDWTYRGRDMRLMDTAGIRKRTKLFKGKTSTTTASADHLVKGMEGRSTKENRKADATLEDQSIQESLFAMNRSQIVVMVVDVMAQKDEEDANGCLTKHDMAIMGRALDEGRGLVVVANKCDIGSKESMENKKYRQSVIDWVRADIERVLPLARGVPIIPTSALNNDGVKDILPTVLETYDKWKSRIKTHPLNVWVRTAQLNHPPPAAAGAHYKQKKTTSGPLKIKYVTQPSSRPPTFILFVNRAVARPNILGESYERYLMHSLRSRFGLEGVPIRFQVRGSDPTRRGRLTRKQRVNDPRRRLAPIALRDKWKQQR